MQSRGEMEMKSAHLIIVGGDVQTGEFHTKLPTTIGRGQAATVTIPHPLVSRLHCKIYERNGRLYVRDLSSLNGTFVNNRRIDRETSLSPGDIITVGGVRLQTAHPKAKLPRVLAGASIEQSEDGSDVRLSGPATVSHRSHETTMLDLDQIADNSDTQPAPESMNASTMETIRSNGHTTVDPHTIVDSRD